MEVLVVGLGNRNVTPDSLGPLVADHLLVTRHMLNEYGSYAFGKKKMNRISSIVPGVMAQTGMECAEIIGGIVRQTKPDLVVAVDALAARSVKRLNRTIQVTDTGIIPGSGVGNHRHGLNEKSMGVPVLSVGIPTVIDAATIVRDAVQHVMAMTDDPVGRLLVERITPGLQAMFVTSKDIDESVRKLSSILADGLNIAYGGVHTKSASGIS
jgi:spore protease